MHAEVGAHLAHGERGRVGGEQAVGTDERAQRGEDLLFDRRLLDHGLEHEVAVCEGLVAGRAGHDRRQKTRLLGGQAAACRRAFELVADRLQRAVDDPLLDVAEHDRHLQPAQEERCKLGRHQPGAHDSHLAHGPRPGVGPSGLSLSPALHEVEGVDRGLCLRSGQQVGDRLLFGAVTLLDRP